MFRGIHAAAFAAPVLFPVAVFATDPEVAELRRALAAMKAEYDARIAELEKRIAEAETRTTPASGVEPAATPAAQPPARRSGDAAFNPAISLVLQGAATSYSREPEAWTIPGFQVGGEAGLKPEGLSLTETELTASANVDNLFYGQATVGFHEDAGGGTEVDVEEAFIDTLSLPAGFGLRFGRFYPEIGYLNTRHTHAWDFADAPLTAQAFLGYQYKDDGLRLSWVAPAETYLEIGAEALRGDKFPASGDGSDLTGSAQNYFVRAGRDIGDSQSFRVGISHLRAQPEDRTGGHAHAHEGGEAHGDEALSFTGDSDLTVVDATWKWAPDGNFGDRALTLRGEYFYRDEDGLYSLDSDAGSALLPYDGTQRGWYVEGIYRFAPRWRAGLRYDRLSSDNALTVAANDTDEDDEEIIAETGLVTDHDPNRWSAMVDWSPSEFSRLRLQYARDKTLPDADDQWQLQYIMSIGAHGAHPY